MAGVTPLLNAQFVSGGQGVDFSGVGFTGAANDSTLRTFEFVYANANTRTLQASDLWKNIYLGGGNALVTVPDNLNAALGDEINIVNPNGTITLQGSGTTSIINSAYTATTAAARPLKLINVGTNIWVSVSTNTPYNSFFIYDCCNTTLNGGSIWQFNPPGGNFSTTGTVYSNSYGGALYDSTPGVTALSNVVKIGNIYSGYPAEGYVTSGNFYSSACQTLNYYYNYTFYYSNGVPTTLYTSTNAININNDLEVQSVRWKTTTASLYSCESSYDITGPQLLYRYYDAIYGASYPVCFQNGFATRFDGQCP